MDQIARCLVKLIEKLGDNNVISHRDKIELMWWLYHPEEEVEEMFKKHLENLKKKLGE